METPVKRFLENELNFVLVALASFDEISRFKRL
jgi:hypothetical protein